VSTSATITCESPPRRTAGLITAAVVACVLIACSVTEVQARLAFSPCIFRNVTGLPCPGCGMTRGFTAMGHGRPAEAWRFNPLAPFAYMFAWGYVAFTLLSVRFPALRNKLRPRPRVRWALFAVVFAAVLTSWAITLIHYFAGPPS